MTTNDRLVERACRLLELRRLAEKKAHQTR
jgi:hypothetical protein